MLGHGSWGVKVALFAGPSGLARPGQTPGRRDWGAIPLMKGSAQRAIGRPGTAGRLFVVATPLGNLEDISLRALRVLREVRLIACEDTRRTAHLLHYYGITAQTTSYYEHNERVKSARILDLLRCGHDVALVCDAGTPAISDPGFRVVRDARAAGFAVFPVPGPNAAIAALSVSGLPTDRFLFVGFLPSRSTARRRAIEDLADRRETLVLHESPVRILSTLSLWMDVAGDRQAFLCREATKLHEEHIHGRLSEIHRAVAERPAVKGEIVLVVAGARTDRPDSTESSEELFRRLVAEGLTRRRAVKETARRLGLPAREVYRRTLSEKGEPAISKRNCDEGTAPVDPPCGRDEKEPAS